MTTYGNCLWSMSWQLIYFLVVWTDTDVENSMHCFFHTHFGTSSSSAAVDQDYARVRVHSRSENMACKKEEKKRDWLSCQMLCHLARATQVAHHTCCLPLPAEPKAPKPSAAFAQKYSPYFEIIIHSEDFDYL